MPNPAIEIQGLVKRYGSNIALNGLDLTLPRGAVAGFVFLYDAGSLVSRRIG